MWTLTHYTLAIGVILLETLHQIVAPELCLDSVSESLCTLYLNSNGWHCSDDVANNVTLGEVCQKSCGRCGPNPTPPGNSECWNATLNFSSCCDMSISNVGQPSCWAAGIDFETCCLGLGVNILQCRLVVLSLTCV